MSLLAATPSGKIAYLGGASADDLNVAVLDLASGASTPLSQASRATPPRWSPDGQWLAYGVERDGGAAIEIVRVDGAERLGVSHARKWNLDPRWSPTGRMIAYSAGKEMNLAREAVVYNLDTREETAWGPVEQRPKFLAGFLRPVWLPNLKLMGALKPDQQLAAEGVDFGKLIGEASGEGAVAAIAVVNTPKGQTTEPFLVTRTQAVPLLPFVTQDSRRYAEWNIEPAPNGERIAFDSNDGGDREVFIIGRTGLQDVSNHPASDWSPSWANENARLAFESFRSGRRGIYRVFVDTARVTPVDVGTNYDCWSPCWSPDGEWIAYVSDRGGTPSLWLRDERGENEKQLTKDATALAPAWQPKPKKKK